MFKAKGSIWHHSDREANHIPENLHHLDQDDSWGKSVYHRWIYGHNLHLRCNLAGFPKMVQVDIANLDDSKVVDQKKEGLFVFQPEEIVGYNSYFKAMRVRRWARLRGCSGQSNGYMEKW